MAVEVHSQCKIHTKAIVLFSHLISLVFKNYFSLLTSYLDKVFNGDASYMRHYSSFFRINFDSSSCRIYRQQGVNNVYHLQSDPMVRLFMGPQARWSSDRRICKCMKLLK